ncbi:hypothetical protein H696_04563 [Fonticula alba]|uniref:Uncharacterized protein n=1 Tax=Fonticula alba TaxID=691883 RepID=A0A058Z4D2_FONAL|nr:hypothetical protein H696_04563 [Fonticula alba]KCV69149.1 hypothetical protein H696_04563 [Fonticula alba]|eukprot:XP_009496720.1 hypothetical protein H696_04563 [Fonticula alba]
MTASETSGRRQPLGRMVSTLALLGMALASTASAASVMSIDYGSEWFKVAYVRPGSPMDIALNPSSQRKTASSIGFARDGERLIGDTALASASRQPHHTYTGLLDILGLPADHPKVISYLERSANQVVVRQDQETGADRLLLKGPDGAEFHVEELIAIQLAEAATFAAHSTGEPVTDTVLVIPSYFTQPQRKAILNAAKLAGLNVLGLTHSTTSAALQYAIGTRLSEKETHLFVDIGAGSVSASVVGIVPKPPIGTVKGKKTAAAPTARDPLELNVLSHTHDVNSGGRALDELLAMHLGSLFDRAHKRKTPVYSEPRARARLLHEASRVKQVLSVNVETISRVEGLHDGLDFSAPISRATFEELAAPIVQRIGATVRAALAGSGLSADDLTSVKLFGGGTRVPLVQRALREALNVETLAHNINADEAAALGGAFRAASLLSTFRTRTVRVREHPPVPVFMPTRLAADTDDAPLVEVPLFETAASRRALARPVGRLVDRTTLPVTPAFLDRLEDTFADAAATGRLSVPVQIGATETGALCSLDVEVAPGQRPALVAVQQALRALDAGAAPAGLLDDALSLDMFLSLDSFGAGLLGVVNSSVHVSPEASQALGLATEATNSGKAGIIGNILSFIKGNKAQAADKDAAEDEEFAQPTDTTVAAEPADESASPKIGASDVIITAGGNATAAELLQQEAAARSTVIPLKSRITCQPAGLSAEELTRAREQIARVDQAEADRRARHDSMNALEGAIYRIGGALSAAQDEFLYADAGSPWPGAAFARFALGLERRELSNMVSEFRDWYEDYEPGTGQHDDTPTAEYQRRLEQLQDLERTILARRDAWAQLGPGLEAVKNARAAAVAVIEQGAASLLKGTQHAEAVKASTEVSGAVAALGSAVEAVDAWLADADVAGAMALVAAVDDGRLGEHLRPAAGASAPYAPCVPGGAASEDQMISLQVRPDALSSSVDGSPDGPLACDPPLQAASDWEEKTRSLASALDAVSRSVKRVETKARQALEAAARKAAREALEKEKLAKERAAEAAKNATATDDKADPGATNNEEQHPAGEPDEELNTTGGGDGGGGDGPNAEADAGPGDADDWHDATDDTAGHARAGRASRSTSDL